MSSEAEVTIATISFLSALVGLAAAVVGRKKVVEVRYVVDTTSNGEQPSRPAPPWYDNTWWLVLWTVLFWPVGIYGVLRSNRVTSGWKVGVAILVLIMLGAASKH